MNISQEKPNVKYIQREKVFNHLDRLGSITTKDAFEIYGITRLSAKIYELRKMGLIIDTVRERGFNRFGEPTNYARYYLRRDI